MGCSGDGSISILDLSSDNWTYIFDIKNSTEQDKAIYDMELYEDFIFVATGYGIQKISTSDFSFVDAPYYKFGYLTERSKVTDIKNFK